MKWWIAIKEYWPILSGAAVSLFGAIKWWTGRRRRAIDDEKAANDGAALAYETADEMAEQFTKRVTALALKVSELTDTIIATHSENRRLKAELEQLKNEQREQSAIIKLVAELMERVVAECGCEETSDLRVLRNYLGALSGD